MNRLFGIGALVAAVGLVGCASTKARRQQLDQIVEAELPSDTPETRKLVHTDLIRRMIGSQQYYAALAHIQAQMTQSGTAPELRLLEAEVRRKLGQSAQAQEIYRELLKNRTYTADAYYGLGLISAKSNLGTAIWQLQQAVQRRPADADMRNDLGYALMLSRRYPEALTELATAVELEAASGSAKARNNLILLMLVTGDEPAVRRLVQETGMSADTLAGLRRQAQALSRPAAATPTG